jgi:PAS domain S-box-containing protein
MNTQPGPSFTKFIIQGWAWLTDPIPTVSNLETRRQARLLASLLIILIAIGLPIEFSTQLYFLRLGVPHNPIGLVALIVLAGGYWLARRGDYKLSAWITILVCSAAIFLMTFSSGPLPVEIEFLAFLFLPLMLASVFLPQIQVLGLAGVYVLLMLVSPVFFKEISSFDIAYGPLTFTLLATGTIYLVVQHQRLLERDRQSELAERGERYRTLVETTYEGICIHSDGVIQDANPGFARLLGYSVEEVIGKSWADFALPKYRHLARRDFQPKPGRVYQVMRKDESQIYVEVVTRQQLYHDQSVEVTAVRDVSERVNKEKDLVESEERYRTLAEAAHDAIFVIDRDFAIQYLNHFAASSFGLQPEDMFGKPMEIFFPPDVAERQMESLRLIFETGEPTYSEQEAFYQRRKIWQSTWLAPIRDETKEVRAVMGISRDMTIRKQAEDGLRESQRQMNALVTSLDDIVFEFDEQGTYLNIWTSNKDLLARPEEELIGRKITDILGEEFARPFLESFQRVLSSGQVESIDYQLAVPDGLRWFNARISPITTGDGSRFTISMLIRDVTERKKVEEEAQGRLKRLQALREIDEVILSSVDLGINFRTILGRVRSHLGVDAASILLLNPHSMTLEYIEVQGFQKKAIENMHFRLREGYAGRAVIERRAIEVPDLRARNNTISSALSSAFNDEAFVSYFAVPLLAKGQVKGVMEIFHRSPLVLPPELSDFLNALAGQTAIAIDNAGLFVDLQRSNQDLLISYDATIDGWSKALELRDKETQGHTQRVTEMTLQLARAFGLDASEMVHLRRGAILHDIGKMGIPDQVLFKPGKLDEEEWKLIQKHPQYAFELLSAIPYLRRALDIPYCHHEKWDGSGYPRGLQGQEIPLAARIFAVVDVWDAVTHDRPYRHAWSPEEATSYIREQSGKHFDPSVVAMFLKIIENLKS